MNKVKFFHKYNLEEIEKEISEFVDKTKAFIVSAETITLKADNGDICWVCTVVYRIS
jgi:hypothetical protein